MTKNLKPVRLDKTPRLFKVTAKEDSYVIVYHRRPRNDLRVEKYAEPILKGASKHFYVNEGQNLWLLKGSVDVDLAEVLDSRAARIA